MKRNVEIKVRPTNFNEIKEAAKNLKTFETKLYQEDYYYESSNGGRCKLRYIEENNYITKSELIYYERPDLDLNKTSNFYTYKTEDLQSLKLVLDAALKRINSVIKDREVMFIGDIRIHFDTVQSLGEFVEIEIPLSNEITEEKGHSIMKKLIGKLGIKGEFIKCSYTDLMNNK